MIDDSGKAPVPYYERGGVRLYHGRAEDVLPHLTERGHCIFDAPYSAHTHTRSRRGVTGRDRRSGLGPSIPNDFGFGHLTPALRRSLAHHAKRLSARWTLVFSDVESAWLWRLSLCAAGMDYVRTLYWEKLGGTPQFTGDRPAVACEVITLAHPRGRKVWNGGGKRGIYSVPIVREHVSEPREHTTQKPEALMLALVEDFTDPGELVYDFTCGFATTGIACLRGKGAPRRFVGVEMSEAYCEKAARRLDAELSGSTYAAREAGQRALFDLAPKSIGASK